MAVAKISKAMILAAGLGTRMRPLTNTMPKPVLPIGSTTPIELAIETLKRAGINDIVINLHHLPEKIKERLGDGSSHNIHITYSFEPVILGTGGGIKNVEGFFGDKPFILYNCDVISNIDIPSLIATHFMRNAAATLVVRGHEENYTRVDIDANGYLKDFGSGQFMYASVAVLTRELLNALPPKGKASCLINDGLKKLITNKKNIATYLHGGDWYDIGTIEKYQALISSGALK